MRTTLRILVPLTLLVVNSCGSASESSAPSTSAVTVPTATSPGTTSPDTLPGDDVSVAVYFVAGEHLTVEGRDVASWDGATVMQALLDGPDASERAAGVSTLIPPATVLHGVTVQGSEAVVDLSADFESGGGSLSMMLRVSQVVFTLTQLPDVDTVRFRIDGELRDMLSGEGLMVDGVDRTTFADEVLPGILLEQPFDGSVLADPIVIGGMTNAYEATVNYQLLDAQGAVLVEGMAMATCGSGCWGGFTASIPVPPGAVPPLTLRVFDISEADGTTMLDTVTVVLT